MSPVASTTASPLLEAVATNVVPSESKRPSHAGSSETDSAGGSFGDVQSKIASAHRATKPKPTIPIDTTLTASIPQPPGIPAKPPLAQAPRATEASSEVASSATKPKPTIPIDTTLTASIPQPPGIPAKPPLAQAPRATEAELATARPRGSLGPTDPLSQKAPVGAPLVEPTQGAALLPSVDAQASLTLQARVPLARAATTSSAKLAANIALEPSHKVVGARESGSVSRTALAEDGLKGSLPTQATTSVLASHDEATAAVSSSALAPTTSDVVGSTTIGQLGTVVAQVVREGNLPRTVTIALEPKELGQLQLQVSTNGGEIQVHIQVADPTVRGLVGTQLESLTSALNRDLGFSGQQPDAQRQQPGVPSAQTNPSSQSVELEVQAPQRVIAHSLVDLRL